ncbi:MAG: isochorismate synthase MenF [Microcoleaceae cyanobacterium]
MLVLSPSSKIFQDREELYCFLLDFKQGLKSYEPEKILSITQEIQPLDLLEMMAVFAPLSQLHFYCEKSNTGEAIIAFDAVADFCVNGRSRFSQALEFIKACRQRITRFGCFQASSSPHFCCSFTFFDQGHRQTSTLFLPVIQVLKREDHYFLTLNLELSPTFEVGKTAAQAWEIIQKVQSLSQSARPHLNTCSARLTLHRPSINPLDRTHLNIQQIDCLDTHPVPFKIQSSDEQQFQQSVSSSLDLIQSKTLDKIVLARAIDVQADQAFDLIRSLKNLRSLYPNCCIFSTRNAQNQTFIGASPERLVGVYDGQLITDSLAGSAPRGRSEQEDLQFANHLLSSRKDRWEHQVVVNFIRESLRQLGLQPCHETQPYLMKLSNIQHLWTPITAPLTQGIHVLEILAQLHPTPAAAGNPRDLAQEKIQYYEPFDRLLYAAPIGWIDADDNGEFIVGIRSALVQGNQARLFAGAGIVAGSEPEKEAAEIQLKFQALLRALV